MNTKKILGFSLGVMTFWNAAAWADEPLIQAGETASKLIEAGKLSSSMNSGGKPVLEIARIFLAAIPRSSFTQDLVVDSRWNLVATANLEEGRLLAGPGGLAGGMGCAGKAGVLSIGAAGKDYAGPIELNNVLCLTFATIGRIVAGDVKFMYEERVGPDQKTFTTYECRLPEADALICKTAVIQVVSKFPRRIWTNEVVYLIFSRIK